MPNTNPKEVVAAARERLEQRLSDGEWTGKLMAGDRAVVSEWERLCMVARPGEDEPMKG